jgi:AcrR family transcriptional regulator
MADRGPYAKGVARRQEILRSTLDVFATLGSGKASMAAIARHVGVSPALLQYYFSTRDDLLRGVIEEWDRDHARRGEGLTHFADWLQGTRQNMETPGLIHLYMTAVVEATDPEHPARSFYADRYRDLTPTIAAEVARQQELGWVSAELDPERVTRVLLATIEGLQIRWLHEPGFDLAAEFLFAMQAWGIQVPELESGTPDSATA